MRADDRRRTPRREPDERDPLARVRLRVGRELQVVNISNGGVLVHGQTRLLPGTPLDVHVVTRHGRILVRGRVVRAYVARLASDDVWYRGAVAFERLIDASATGYEVPDPRADIATSPGSPYPTTAPTADGLNGEVAR
jgi:hypothetical protein